MRQARRPKEQHATRALHKTGNQTPGYTSKRLPYVSPVRPDAVRRRGVGCLIRLWRRITKPSHLVIVPWSIILLPPLVDWRWQVQRTRYPSKFVRRTLKDGAGLRPMSGG